MIVEDHLDLEEPPQSVHPDLVPQPVVGPIWELLLDLQDPRSRLVPRTGRVRDVEVKGSGPGVV